MKIKFVLLSLVFLCAGNCFAQKEKPDFSGTWLMEEFRSLSTGAAIKSSKYMSFFKQVIIKQNPPEINFKEKILFEAIRDTGARKILIDSENEARHFADEREEINTLQDDTKIESVSKWKDSKLVIAYHTTDIKNSKKKILGTTEVELSKDGKTLTITRKESGKEFIGENDFSIFPDLKNRKEIYKLSSK